MVLASLAARFLALQSAVVTLGLLEATLQFSLFLQLLLSLPLLLSSLVSFAQGILQMFNTSQLAEQLGDSSDPSIQMVQLVSSPPFLCLELLQVLGRELILVVARQLVTIYEEQMA